VQLLSSNPCSERFLFPLTLSFFSSFSPPPFLRSAIPFTSETTSFSLSRPQSPQFPLNAKVYTHHSSSQRAASFSKRFPLLLVATAEPDPGGCTRKVSLTFLSSTELGQLPRRACLAFCIHVAFFRCPTPFWMSAFPLSSLKRLTCVLQSLPFPFFLSDQRGHAFPPGPEKCVERRHSPLFRACLFRSRFHLLSLFLVSLPSRKDQRGSVYKRPYASFLGGALSRGISTLTRCRHGRAVVYGEDPVDCCPLRSTLSETRSSCLYYTGTRLAAGFFMKRVSGLFRLYFHVGFFLRLLRVAVVCTPTWGSPPWLAFDFHLLCRSVLSLSFQGACLDEMGWSFMSAFSGNFCGCFPEHVVRFTGGSALLPGCS